MGAVNFNFPETDQGSPPAEAPAPSQPRPTAACVRNENPGIDRRLASTLTRLTQEVTAVGTCAFNPRLQNILKEVVIEYDGQTALPPAKKIAPNQHSWTETALVMGVPSKATKASKRKNTDPYGGGEQSGKRAKPDARIR